VKLENGRIQTAAAAMVDSGATGLFMNRQFAEAKGVKRLRLLKPIQVFNIDGTPNQAGSIQEFARLAMTVDGHKHWVDFLITDIGGEDLILGLPWLRRLNPTIDWSKGLLSLRPKQVSMEEVPDYEGQAIGGTTTGEWLIEDSRLDPVPTPEIEEEEKEPEPKLYHIKGNRRLRREWARNKLIDGMQDQVWIAAGYIHSQQLTETARKDKPVRTFEEMVPEPYREYGKVFSEQESERLPEHKPWDHAIELHPNAPETLRTKIYPMSPTEQEELNRFIDDNLRKGYIRLISGRLYQCGGFRIAECRL